MVICNRNDIHFAGKASKILRGGMGVTRRVCHRHVPSRGMGGRAPENRCLGGSGRG